MSTVRIRGNSVAACCCASLLARARVPFSRDTASRPKLPAIMIGETTQRMLGDIFPEQPLFHGLPPIRRRIVKWGATPPLTLPHSAIVVSEQVLLDRLEPSLPDSPTEPSEASAWTIVSARPLPEASDEFHFGSRTATASSVQVKPSCDGEASWLESLPGGWLFLLPNGATSWLLSVGDSVTSLLAESRLIAGQILRVDENGGSFPSHPRIAERFCGSDWMACGSAALGFDPLCGDGSGYAAREAILASAVVQAAAQGMAANELIAHYRSRVIAGFEKHLAVCLEFYTSGHAGPWWDEQIGATRKGLAWCQSQRAGWPGFKYRLEGFSLQRI